MGDAVKADALLQPISLALWSAVLLQSAASGRLDLLLRAVFHPLVWGSGLVLLALAAVGLAASIRSDARSGAWSGARLTSGQRTALLLGCVAAIAVLWIPPRPSFADLAANRGRELLEEPGLSFVVPPGQRSLTEWVRLLRSEPDPGLHSGDPVRISGFVLPVPGDRPQLARLLVRCCLVDATPVGLPVLWPGNRPIPPADQWLEMTGVMTSERFEGRQRSVVKPSRWRPIPRPQRPLEP
ncbi:TIGR03943 family protein [Synechococcus sp. CS-1325]|nr:TIGR03943 family protein [Synechococcus sp. CS-1325]PZU98996.1 MAG: TIGR03943 family protein [Cyanobium sp.]